MATHHVYIIFSEKMNQFYVGDTDLEPQTRLDQHNNREKPEAFTAPGIPWSLFLVIPCSTRLQARRIELHIKKMKSKSYILNLRKYPEMIEKLLRRFDIK